ncbi:hypothetical protein FHG87_010404 [Trinorchestia longiramus]|nr:hypothetical protein FHG87_010404 [Trinorchestia longiramus]
MYCKTRTIFSVEVVDEDEKFINSRLIDLSNVLGFLYFAWHVLRPEDPFPDLNDFYGRSFDGNTEANDTSVDKDFDEVFSRSYEIVMNSLDPVSASLEYMGVQDPHCKQRMMCATRRAMASFSVTESAAQRLGWLLGSFPKYEDALRHGRELHDCHQHYPECSSLPLPFL